MLRGAKVLLVEHCVLSAHAPPKQVPLAVLQRYAPPTVPEFGRQSARQTPVSLSVDTDRRA